MNNELTSYINGIEHLLARLDRKHLKYCEVLALQYCLLALMSVDSLPDEVHPYIAEVSNILQRALHLYASEREICPLLCELLLTISFNDLCRGKLASMVSCLQTKGVSELQIPSLSYSTGRHWAVLVGVNYYEDRLNYGRLQVCVKDARALYDQLLASGFDAQYIRLLVDNTNERPKRENILSTLKSVAGATEPNDVLLFYYTGHGDEEEGKSYLIASNSRRMILDDTAVPLSRVKEIMESAPAKAKIMILDACHSGVRVKSKSAEHMSAEFIRRVFEQAEGMAILASCEQGQKSYEWSYREQSVFTYYLLEALKGQADYDQKGFVTTQDVNRYVVDHVKLWASQNNCVQSPTFQTSVIGDIILSRYAFCQ